MPELPEVHTITTDLKELIQGHTIISIQPVGGYKIQGNYEDIIGKSIVKVRRIAKNIIIETSEHAIIMHLAMTGRVLVMENQARTGNWVRVIFSLNKNATNTIIAFTDMRMFGKVVVIKREELSKLVEKYGPEPIDEGMTSEKFLEAIKSKNTIIKNVLLDQSIVAGLGNIYATDALFLAGIHPERHTKSISIKDAEKLLKAAKTVLNEGIEKRGSTLPDKMYVDLFGKEGKYQEHFKIYMQEKCPRCKEDVVYTKIQGRGTYYCPICQPKEQTQTAQKRLF